jgi:hypothetical protein
MQYFPDSFFRRIPPKEYFWKVFATIEPDTFKNKYNDNLNRIYKTIVKPDLLQIDPIHKQLLLQRKEENISLGIALKKAGVLKNIIYLKKIKREKENPLSTMDRYMRPALQGKANFEEEPNEQIYEDE